jgi:hypothetical protein
MAALCKIDDCERGAQARGWCKMHWARWRRNGDPLVVKVCGIDWNAKVPCGVEGCDRITHANLMCGTHLRRFQRHGDASVVLPITGRPLLGQFPKWASIHKRLSRKLGKASIYSCVDCNSPAKEWSYNNADPNELHELMSSTPVAYSLDLDNYDPRCVSCHRKFDGAGSKRERTARGTFAKNLTEGRKS